jgi:hypothetical protein
VLHFKPDNALRAGNPVRRLTRFAYKVPQDEKVIAPTRPPAGPPQACRKTLEQGYLPPALK